jgi:HAMP domain-containing protein
MEKIKKLGLKLKFGVIILVVLAIVVFILLIVLRGALNREFEMFYGSPGTKGLFIAKLLAAELKPTIEHDVDILEVQQELQQIVADTYKAVYGIYSVRYMFVQDGFGNVLVDTFGKDKKVPQGIVDLNPLGEERCTSFNLRGHKYYDCAQPLTLKDKTTGEESTGAVRVGIIDQNPQSGWWQKLKMEHVDGIFKPLLYLSVLLVLLITVLLTLAFWYFVIRRIDFLSEATERMSFGDLETVVPIKSQDEIGTLEDTLERMRANLKDAIERLKRRK